MKKYIDYKLIYVISFITVLGLLMLYSATINIDTDVVFYKQHAVKQITFIIISLCISFVLLSDNHVFKNINIQYVYDKSWYFYGLVAIALFLVLSGMGHSVNGSTRWIKLFGFSIQPSEFAKLVIIITVAKMITRQNIRGLTGIIKTLAITSPFILLILFESDIGASVIIVLSAFAMIFIAGTHLGFFALIILFLSIVLAVIIALDPNRINRLYDFFDGSYQGTQALVGIVRGDLFGVGVGGGLQKISKLSETHTDMIFSLIVEELGLVFSILIIFAYAYIYYRGFQIAMTAISRGNNFSSYLAFGISFWLSTQTIYNILMNVDLVPIKGFTLPFISYGGSSMVVSIIAVTILIKIDIDNKQRYA